MTNDNSAIVEVIFDNIKKSTLEKIRTEQLVCKSIVIRMLPAHVCVELRTTKPVDGDFEHSILIGSTSAMDASGEFNWIRKDNVDNNVWNDDLPLLRQPSDDVDYGSIDVGDLTNDE
jgi:hypothetical protein